MLGLHIRTIHETALLFQTMSPEQKQTTICVQNPNCTQLCHEVWASQYTQNWNQLCKTDSAFRCPLLKSGVRVFCEQACDCVSVVGECVCRKPKILSSAACSWRFIGSRRGHGLSRLTNPSWDTGKLRGLKNMEEHGCPRLAMQSIDCSFSLCQLKCQ